MTSKWGYGRWGTGAWGQDAYVTDNRDTLLDNWPIERLRPSDGEPLYDLLVVYARALGTIDHDTEYLDSQRRLQTATDEELAKLAAEVGVARETGESDDSLRFRTLIAKAATRSDSTFDDIAEVLEVLFEDKVDQLALSSKSASPVLVIDMPQSLIDDTPLTATELEDALTPLVPAGERVKIVTTDQLILGESGSQGLGGDLV